MNTCKSCGKAKRILLLFTDTQEAICFPCQSAPDGRPLVIARAGDIDSRLWELTQSDCEFLLSVGVALV